MNKLHDEALAVAAAVMSRLRVARLKEMVARTHQQTEDEFVADDSRLGPSHVEEAAQVIAEYHAHLAAHGVKLIPREPSVHMLMHSAGSDRYDGWLNMHDVAPPWPGDDA